jgi:hypothetical protein
MFTIRASSAILHGGENEEEINLLRNLFATICDSLNATMDLVFAQFWIYFCILDRGALAGMKYNRQYREELALEEEGENAYSWINYFNNDLDSDAVPFFMEPVDVTSYLNVVGNGVVCSDTVILWDKKFRTLRSIPSELKYLAWNDK